MDENHIANESVSKENVKQESNQITITETKKQGKRVFLVSLGLLLSFLIVTCLFLFFGKNSKTLFLYAINQEYADFVSKQTHFFNNTIGDESKNSTLKMEGSLSVDVDSNDKNLKDLEKYSLDYTIFHDYKKQNLLYQLQTYYDEKTLIDIRTYGTDNILYLELKDLFSKYISVEVEKYENIFDNSSIREEDFDYIIQSTKNLVLESLQDNDFTKTRDKVSMEDKTITALKINYVLDEENFKDSYEFVLKEILKDDKFLEIISKYIDIDINQIKEILAHEKSEISNKNYLNGNTFNFSVYFKSLFNEPIKYEIVGNNEKIEYFPKENEKIMIFSENNVQKFSFSMKDNEIHYLIHDKINVTGTLKVTEKNIDLSFNEINDNVSGNLIITNQDKYNGKIKLSIKNEDNNIIINGRYKNTIGQEVKLPKNLKENSISYEKLTEQHYNEIIDNISKNEKLSKWLNLTH